MAWVSHDFVIKPDGGIEDLGQSTFSDRTVSKWCTVFNDPDHGTWYVMVDQPRFIVMRAVTGPENNPRLRFSINVPVEE